MHVPKIGGDCLRYAFGIDDPRNTNPFFVHGRRSDLISKLYKESARAEHDYTRGIVNPQVPFNVDENIFNRYQFWAAIGELLTSLRAIYLRSEQNKLANKDLHTQSKAA